MFKTMGAIRKDIETAGFVLPDEIFNRMTYFQLCRFRRKAIKAHRLCLDLRQMMEQVKPKPKAEKPVPKPEPKK